MDKYIIRVKASNEIDIQRGGAAIASMKTKGGAMIRALELVRAGYEGVMVYNRDSKKLVYNAANRYTEDKILIGETK